VVLRKEQIRGHPTAKPTVDELLASRERMNRASVEFLKIDLQTALTFVQIARQTNDNLGKKRNYLAARKAYETVVRLIRKIELSAEDLRFIKQRLEQVQSELEALEAC
jgi:hypothetical protein